MSEMLGSGTTWYTLTDALKTGKIITVRGPNEKVTGRIIGIQYEGAPQCWIVSVHEGQKPGDCGFVRKVYVKTID